MNLTAKMLFSIILMCVTSAVGLTVYIFHESKGDTALKLAALVFATNIATALVAIASTLLTGKDLSHRDPSTDDLPSGATQTRSLTSTSTSVTKVPPIIDMGAEIPPA